MAFGLALALALALKAAVISPIVPAFAMALGLAMVLVCLCTCAGSLVVWNMAPVSEKDGSLVSSSIAVVQRLRSRLRMSIR